MRTTLVILTSLIVAFGSTAALAGAAKNQAQKGRSQDQGLVNQQQTKAGKQYGATDPQSRNRNEEMNRAETKNYEEMGQEKGKRNEKMNRQEQKSRDKGR